MTAEELLAQLPPDARALLRHLAELGRDPSGNLVRLGVVSGPAAVGLEPVAFKRAFELLEACGLATHTPASVRGGMFKFDAVYLTIEGEALTAGFDVQRFREQASIVINANAPIASSPINIGAGTQVVHLGASLTPGRFVLRASPEATYSSEKSAIFLFATIENDGDKPTSVVRVFLSVRGSELHPADHLGFEPLAVDGARFAGAAPMRIEPAGVVAAYWQFDVNAVGLRATIERAKSAGEVVSAEATFEGTNEQRRTVRLKVA